MFILFGHSLLVMIWGSITHHQLLPRPRPGLFLLCTSEAKVTSVIRSATSTRGAVVHIIPTRVHSHENQRYRALNSNARTQPVRRQPRKYMKSRTISANRMEIWTAPPVAGSSGDGGVSDAANHGADHALPRAS